MKLRSIATSSLLSVGLLLSSASLCAQSSAKPAEIAPQSAESGTPTQTHWDQTQLITSTVHQAWILSGKNEATFFEMVEQLADLSAKNRGITLPDSEAAGRRMGEYIKRSAKADTDQLLYAVVDKAVLASAHTPAHSAGGSGTR
jgi:hypothetical protein